MLTKLNITTNLWIAYLGANDPILNRVWITTGSGTYSITGPGLASPITGTISFYNGPIKNYASGNYLGALLQSQMAGLLVAGQTYTLTVNWSALQNGVQYNDQRITPFIATNRGPSFN